MEKNWKKIWTTANPIEAEIISQMLNENEVHAVVINKQVSQYNIGATEVYVHESQENIAQELISQSDLEGETENED